MCVNPLKLLLMKPVMCLGYFQGSGEEPFTEAVRGSGSRPGHYQTVLPRRRKRFEEGVLGKIARAAELTIRSELVHADNGHSYQDLRHVTSQSRYIDA